MAIFQPKIHQNGQIDHKNEIKIKSSFPKCLKVRKILNKKKSLKRLKLVKN